MEWFKKHVDALMVIATIFSSMIWMNGKFNEVDKEISDLKTKMEVIKTILIMKDIMPKELAQEE